ncbi:hypothetical protein KRP22_011147 [Phytophthora ramorum]|uniref:PAX3- and PAX7-binding protein 1 n=1 Tax=Phytophthora ramorum TaxID=164328 RepID=UPI0030964A6E|nr:PAX3- and PAX7-binding protein 1 [Phytophthora ramorum]KAH7504488.1 PAX3- and PAX7-binding protein 1 [Phytophthora ramorum]
MFRSKKKKVQGRKRREVEAEEGAVAANVSADIDTTYSVEIPASNDAVEAESDLQVLEELRRSRSRGSGAKSAMTFSSKSGSGRLSGSSSHAAVAAAETGLLSFDDGEKSRRDKRRKMRPNLVAATAVDVEMEGESVDQYSVEMLATLRSEQSVLLSSTTQEELEVEEGNDEDVKRVVQEAEEEEFISLQGGGKKTRRMKSRVTFGVHSEDQGISKTAEVVEEVSGEEDEDNENSRRWEEELMRRGGHRVPTPAESSGNRSRDGLPTYPTRKNVSCVTLASVLGKLEKGLEATSFEDERASRELARLEAETVLIEMTLKQQQEELLVSSEEFEYFQEVEDFVKGLSFCLREKLPVIEARGKKIVEQSVQQVETKRQEELQGIAEEVKKYLGSGQLQQGDVVGLSNLDVYSNGASSVVPSTNVAQRSARLQKYQQHLGESYVSPDREPEEYGDLFADAIDEINSLDRVYGRFQEWKAKFPEVYKNAFCELAQEKLFAPYVQAELLYWDPLGAADTNIELGKSWSLDDFGWFRVLHQHVRQSDVRGGNIDGPILYQIRDVFLEKVRIAVSRYFDPFSSLQVRSVSLVLEEISRRGYTPHVKDALQVLVGTVLEYFSIEAKRTVLVAVGKDTSSACEEVNVFARYLLERFNSLQDNLLTLFVALPKGEIAAAGFRCLLQVLHHLLAYVRHCQKAQKMQQVPTATQVVRQLSGSSYLLQILSEPSQERELKHVMELFAPFC